MQVVYSKSGFAVVAALTLVALLPFRFTSAQENPEYPGELARLIPGDAIVVGVWHGVPRGDKAHSPVEQSLIEGELASFYRSLIRYVEVTLGAQTEPEIAEAVVRAFSVPGMGYVRTANQPDRPGVSAALILEAGEHSDLLEQKLAAWVQGLEKLEPIQEAEWTLSSYQVEPGLTLELGRFKDRWILTVGAQEGRQLIRRAAGGVPAWWDSLRKQQQLPRPLALVSVDIQAAIQNAQQMNADQADLERLLTVTGLKSAQRASMTLGFDDHGYIHRTWIETDGPPQGLLAGLSAGRLTEQSLPHLPQDTTMGVVVDCDVQQLLELFFEAADESDPQWAISMRQGAQSYAEELGLAKLDELTQAFGTPWTLYHSPSQGGWVNGLAAIIPVRDADAFRRLEKLWIDQIEREVANGGFFFSPLYQQSEYHGETTHTYVNFSSGLFSFSWCRTADYFVVSLSPQNLKPIIDRLGQDADVESPPLRLADGDASAVFALDLKRLLGSPQGLGRMTGRMFELSMRRQLRQFFPRGESVDFATSHFPHGELIRELANEDRLAIYPQPTGILVEGRFTLPGSEWVLIGSLGAMTAIWMDEIGVDPVSFLSPAAARRNESVNHLKMIGLAFHNYHDTFGNLPNYASTGEDGKPLLSWRVHLLPFLDQQELYSQFHLDEPWDSEHNIKLVEQMPQVYRSPNSQAEKGYTNYVAIRSNDSLFPALDGKGKPRNKGIRFGEVLDGLSNTLMAVEANDDSAVIWTQPDDLVPDMQVLHQMVGLHRNQFAVLMADGRVIWLPSDLAHDTLMQVISRAGGEPIDFQEIMVR